MVEFMCPPYNFQVNDNQSHFFEEEGVYWTPGSDCVTIYEQLAQKRFREIARDQVELADCSCEILVFDTVLFVALFCTEFRKILAQDSLGL